MSGFLIYCVLTCFPPSPVIRHTKGPLTVSIPRMPAPAVATLSTILIAPSPTFTRNFLKPPQALLHQERLLRWWTSLRRRRNLSQARSLNWETNVISSLSNAVWNRLAYFFSALAHCNLKKKSYSQRGIIRLRIGVIEKLVFFSWPFWIFFCFIPMKISQDI